MDADNPQEPERKIMRASAMSPETSVSPKAAKPTVSQAQIEVNLVPSAVTALLQREPDDGELKRLHPLWHRVSPHPGALVSLWSRDTLHTRRVRLSVRSVAPVWNARWVRWTYAVRRVPELQGGPAPEAQDLLSDDDSAVTLLLLPGEQRTANLEFLACLDGETYSGDYPFDVVATDLESGESTTTPGLLRLRHPGAEWMQYLPSIYSDPPPEMRADAGMARETALDQTMRTLRYEYRLFETLSFFERFLSGIEDAAMPLQETLANLDRYFSPETTPTDCLPWLSTWVALVMDENWPELKRRQLIREAVELYRWRGTRRGLSRYLEIYTGVKPEINDQPFIGMRLGSNTLLGRDTKLGDVGFHTFVVTLITPQNRPINEQIARDIIEAEKPAHAAYELRIVQRAEGE